MNDFDVQLFQETIHNLLQIFPHCNYNYYGFIMKIATIFQLYHGCLVY
jgi:hypothetical protein